MIDEWDWHNLVGFARHNGQVFGTPRQKVLES